MRPTVKPVAGLTSSPILLVDRGFPAAACNIRSSSMRCKHALQKIDLHGLLADLALQLGDLALAPALSALAWKGIAGRLAGTPAASDAKRQG